MPPGGIRIYHILLLLLSLPECVFPGHSVVKNQPANAGTAGDRGLIPGLGISPGGGNNISHNWSDLAAAAASILAWRIPWTKEPGGLQSMGFQREPHAWVIKHACPPGCNPESLSEQCSRRILPYAKHHHLKPICHFYILPRALVLSPNLPPAVLFFFLPRFPTTFNKSSHSPCKWIHRHTSWDRLPLTQQWESEGFKVQFIISSSFFNFYFFIEV